MIENLFETLPFPTIIMSFPLMLDALVAGDKRVAEQDTRTNYNRIVGFIQPWTGLDNLILIARDCIN